METATIEPKKWKKCKKCGEVKTLDEFYANRLLKDGHVNTCKACMSVERRAIMNQDVNKENPLASFTSRKLLEELRNRGYRGKLVYQQEIDLQKL